MCNINQLFTHLLTYSGQSALCNGTYHVCDACIREVKNENDANSKLELMVLLKIPSDILLHFLGLYALLVSCHLHDHWTHTT